MEAVFCARCGTTLSTGAAFCPRCGTSVPIPADKKTTVSLADDTSETSMTTQDALLETLRQATIGEYEILGVLGRGGMATVYLAHDVSLDRRVAIKVLSPALFQMGEGMVERFKREARTAAALSHPHIIPIYAVKQSHNILYFVMKYVSGRPLDAVIQEIGGLPIKMVQTIVAQVGDALAYAHRHGVIHRDIKSANIMLDDEGWAVVTDFGIAKVEEAQGLTMTGVTVGTPAYMSPEQCASVEVTGATDQYSLGVVAYEMLTGHLPFQSNSSMSVMYAHFNERPHAVTKLRPDCPENLAAAVMRMLEKEPHDRWPTLDDVVAVCGRPSLRRDDPIRSEMRTLAKAGPQSDLLALKVPTSPLAFTKSRVPTTVSPRFRRSRVWWGVGAAAVLGVAGVLLWGRLSNSAKPTQSSLLATDAPTLLQPRDSALTVAPAPVPVAQPATRATRSVRPSPPPAVSTTARQEDSVLTALRMTALTAMRHAAEAGATSADLAHGGTMLRAADSLAGQGKATDAMVQLVSATSAWNDAERVARARVVRDTVRPAAPPPPAPVTVTAQPVSPPVDPRPQIEAAIATYARALESRDTVRVRRANPGLTPAQQKSWGDLFKAVRTLKATLTVTAIDVKGSTADAGVTALYEFDNATTGRVERRTGTFRASFVSDSAGWRLSAIR
jgi:serine/threonine-protein kinase